MHGVLAVRHEHALLDRRARRSRSARPAGRAPAGTRRGAPTRSATFGPGHLVLVAEPHDLPVRQPHALEQVVQHHHPAERRRQRRNQQPVIAPRHHAGDGAGRVAAQAVGHQPLAARRRVIAFEVVLRPRDDAGQVQASSSFCASSSISPRSERRRTAAAPGTWQMRMRPHRRCAAAAVARRLAAPVHRPTGSRTAAPAAARAAAADRGRSRD